MKNNEKRVRKKRLIILMILFLCITVGLISYFFFKSSANNPTSNKNNNDLINNDDKVVDNYNFDSNNQNKDKTKSPNIGMSIKSIILADKSGHAEMAIKNNGDVNITPQVIFNGKVIYQSPLLKPGQTVKANLNFGALSVGEHPFNVLAVYSGGSGISLKSKVVVR